MYFKMFNIAMKNVPAFLKKITNHQTIIKHILFIAFTTPLTVSCQKNEQGSTVSFSENRAYINTLYSGDMVLIQWKAAGEGCFGSEIQYTTLSGADTTVIVPGYQTATQLINYNYNKSVGSFRYRTLYLKDPDSADTSYSKYTTVSNIPKGNYTLPEKTSKYNLGGSQYAGRYKDANGHVKEFSLKDPQATLYDGGGRAIGIITKPVKLNMGTQKEMAIQGKTETYVWAWDTDAGLSGWIARNALIDPPDLLGNDSPFAVTDPTPPGEATTPLKIDATAGTNQLRGLIHRNSNGEVPTTGGNKGTDYAGRNPGPLNYVYLERAVPNVQKGGTSKDSMPDSSLFVPSLDIYGRQITETMAMYQEGDLNKPVNVTFIYGRPLGSSDYGWIARANVGKL